MNKYFNAHWTIIGLICVLILMFVIAESFYRENKQLKFERTDLQDHISTLEHKLEIEKDKQNNYGDFTAFEYNEKLEDICKEQGYEYSVHVEYLEADGIVYIDKSMTVYGDYKAGVSCFKVQVPVND